MKSLGAIEVPSWNGKSFGNMDLVLQLNEHVKGDYVGDYNTFKLRPGSNLNLNYVTGSSGLR